MDTLTERAGKPAARTPMTPARRLTLAVGVPVLLALIGFTGLNFVADAGTGSVQFSRSLPVTNRTLGAHLGDADVTLVPGSVARLSGTLTYSLIRPDLTISGSSVSYHCPVVPAGQCSLTSTLSVPPGDNVNLSSRAGDLTVNSGLAGNMSLSTDTGDLTANGLAGQTASLHTIDGDITASGITAGDMTARSVTGDITLTFTHAPVNVTVSSTTGDISIVLPPGTTRYRIVPNVGVGNLSDAGVPQDSSSSAPVINVSSTTGDISITTG